MMNSIGKSVLAFTVVSAVLLSHASGATEDKNWIEFDEFQSCSELFESTSYDLLLDLFFYRPKLDIPRRFINRCIDQSEEDGLPASSYYAGALLVLAERDEQAQPFLQAAMDAGILEAHTFYGLSLTMHDPIAAYGVHYRSADLGWGYGAYFAGMYKLVGLGVIQKPEIAFELLERANSEGVSAAAVVLGLMYATGHYVRQDQDRAEDLWLASAARGNSYAAYYLALRVMLPDGSYEHAVDLIRAAALRGNYAAQVVLSNFLSHDGPAEEFLFWIEEGTKNPRAMRGSQMETLETMHPGIPLDKALMEINFVW